MRKSRFSDVVTIISGGTPKTDNFEYWNGNIKWLSIADFNGKNKYVYDTDKKITELGVEHSSTSILDKGDIIISARGTVGALAVLSEPMAFNQSCFGLRTKNKNLLNQDYLFYFLKSYLNNIKNKTQGSVFDTINLATFDMFDIQYPDIDKQEKIVSVLSYLDARIEINMQINTELESLAKTIYDYWFLQFDFPNKEGKPYKSSGGAMVWNENLKMEIPEGWEVTTLGQIIVEQPKSTISVEDAKMAEGNIPFFTSGDAILKWDKPIVSGRNCYLNDGGNADVRYCIGETAYSTHTWCITGKNNTSDFLYLTLLTLKPELDVKYFQGSTLKNLNKSALKNRPFFIPPVDIMNSFNEIIQPIFNMISENVRQDQELINLRDFLLPLLMNGQVEVA